MNIAIPKQKILCDMCNSEMQLHPIDRTYRKGMKETTAKAYKSTSILCCTKCVRARNPTEQELKK